MILATVERLPRAQGVLPQVQFLLHDVVILTGGPVGEQSDVSETASQIQAALGELGVNATILDPLPSEDFHRRLHECPPSLCIVIEPRYEDDLGLQDARGALDQLGVPYTGPSIAISEATSDKLRSRHVAVGAGLPVCPGWETPDPEETRLADRLPLIVKPVDRGGGVGVRLCMTEQELYEAVSLTESRFSRCLIEEFFCGVEVAQPVIAIGGALYLFPQVEVEIIGHTIFDDHAKGLTDALRQHIPPRIDRLASRAIASGTTEFARRANWAGLMRADFLVSPERMVFLEANGHPSLGENFGLSVTAAKYVGRTQADVILWLALDVAMRRGHAGSGTLWRDGT